MVISVKNIQEKLGDTLSLDDFVKEHDFSRLFSSPKKIRLLEFSQDTNQLQTLYADVMDTSIEEQDVSIAEIDGKDVLVAIAKYKNGIVHALPITFPENEQSVVAESQGNSLLTKKVSDENVLPHDLRFFNILTSDDRFSIYTRLERVTWGIPKFLETREEGESDEIENEQRLSIAYSAEEQRLDVTVRYHGISVSAIRNRKMGKNQMKMGSGWELEYTFSTNKNGCPRDTQQKTLKIFDEGRVYNYKFLGNRIETILPGSKRYDVLEKYFPQIIDQRVNFPETLNNIVAQKDDPFEYFEKQKVFHGTISDVDTNPGKVVPTKPTN